ncbi:MAG: DUF934 domain-containing protein [Burkholderiales bacterium]|nr:DUF934 domain-containing protein [Burkholderiales bacterium]
MGIVIKNGRIVPDPPPPDVVLEPQDEPSALAARLRTARVVAVRFAAYNDGRGYSIGRMVRERCGYAGELRAVGEVAADHLAALRQCGFDAFELREGEDPQEALAALAVSEALYAAVRAVRARAARAS